MDLTLDESQEILRSTFSELLENECPITLIRDSEETGYAPALWSRYQELGAHLMGLPEALGGLEMSLLELGLVAQASGRALAPVPFLETAASGRLLAELALNSDAAAGDAAGTARAAAEAVAEGSRLVSLVLPRPFAMAGTESPTNAPDAARLVAFGTAADQVLFYDGQDLYLLNAGEGSTARRSPLRVNAGSAALAHWRISDREAPDAILLAQGSAASQAITRASAEWKLLAAFWLVGLAQRALEIGSEYARDRIQFGVPIGGFQGIAHPLADAATRLDGAELLAWEAAWADEADPDRFLSLSSMAFAWAAQTAQRTTDVSLHTHGGYGFSSEYDIQLYYRRAGALAAVAGGAREELQSVASFSAPSSAPSSAPRSHAKQEA
ncbi:MAG: acyl-CoA dehydrogenase family protein [Myxococcota bacterium]